MNMFKTFVILKVCFWIVSCGQADSKLEISPSTSPVYLIPGQAYSCEDYRKLDKGETGVTKSLSSKYFRLPATITWNSEATTVELFQIKLKFKTPDGQDTGCTVDLGTTITDASGNETSIPGWTLCSKDTAEEENDTESPCNQLIKKNKISMNDSGVVTGRSCAIECGGIGVDQAPYFQAIGSIEVFGVETLSADEERPVRAKGNFSVINQP